MPNPQHVEQPQDAYDAFGLRHQFAKHSERRIFAERIVLPRGIGVTFMRDGSVVATDLGEMGCFEFQGELHQRVRNDRGVRA